MLQTDQLLQDLTDEQRAAVTHVDGPLLVVAGAGSGKTRVITRRVAYLMSLGIPAAGVVAITFTNKAAGEMKNRVQTLLGRPMRDFGRLEQPWPILCTFHSLCLRILKHYAPAVGLPPHFSIYDSADQNKLIKEAIKLAEVSATNFTPGNVHGAISNAKNKLQDAEAYAAAAGGFYEKTVARIYKKYQDLLKTNNALDFDDLLMRTAHAFRDQPQVLRELQERFQYILIDEYQDTNHAQYIIAHALAQRHRNICVVGDPDQSIYAWRGADIRNILEFERDYPDAAVVNLEQNYRSTKTILHIASELISHNRRRKEKRLWTENEDGPPATLYVCQDERDEAQLIAKKLCALHEKQNVGWNQMAIFYRINALSRVIEEALRRADMPYVMARGTEFYARKVVKDVLAYMRLIANPNDQVSFARVVNTPPRGIGPSTVRQVETFALGQGVSLWEAMRKADAIPGMTGRAAAAIGKFVTLVERWRGLAERPVPAAGGRLRTLMETVVRESGLEESLKKPGKKEGGEEAGEDPLANVNELITAAAEFDAEFPEGTLEDYLGKISLVSDVDHLKGSGGAVTLMTLHAAKGLEFPVVAMMGMEEGILPHSRAREDEEQMEEERRLCFVGITRAQKQLLLSRAEYRTVRGLRDRSVPSPFLFQMPQEAIEVVDHTGLDEEPKSPLPPLRGQERFHTGQLVRHPQFGIGRIEAVFDAGPNSRVSVQFNQAGRKTLVLAYARLEALG